VIRSLAIDRTRPNRYLVAMKYSVLVSDDAGRHWHRAINSLPGAENMFLIQHPTQPGTFYLGRAYSGKARITVNRGYPPVTPRSSPRRYSSADRGTQRRAVYRHLERWRRGLTRWWSNLAATSRGLDRQVLDVEISLSGALWAATPRGLYSSNDDGRRWAYVKGPGHFMPRAWRLDRAIC
jgi:hypothetical protein